MLTEEEIAELEARNGLLQFDRMLEIAAEAVRSPGEFRLRPSTIAELNRVAVQRLEPTAGSFRTIDVSIENSGHQPPGWEDVPGLVDDLCDYVNENWKGASPIHLASYVMWRLNWIHPFANGNGRTSRVVSYLVLCVRLGSVLPGTKTIPEAIAQDKQPYYEALEAADEGWTQGSLDVSSMEELLRSYLASQLLDIVEKASGG